MTDDIIAVLPFSGNKEKQQKDKNQTLSNKSEARTSTGLYIEHSNAKEMINMLLTRDRLISVSTRIPNFTVSELAMELNVTPLQLKQLCVAASWCYKKMARQINLPLIKLYCGTKFYDSV